MLGIPLDDPAITRYETVNIGLLSTCRQIYLEAISILYSTNIFDLESPSILEILDDNFWSPERVSLIKHLRMYINTHLPYRDSVRFWGIIAIRMQLTSLELLIVMSDTLMDDKMLKPTLKVRGINHVEVRYFADENPSRGMAVAAEMQRRMMSSGPLEMSDACTSLAPKQT